MTWPCCAAADLKTRAAAAESSATSLRQQVQESKQKAAQKKKMYKDVLTRSKQHLEKALEVADSRIHDVESQAQEYSAECELLYTTLQRACLLLHCV